MTTSPPTSAIGTSSGLAWPIALAGTIGYLVTGWNVPDLPHGSGGFLYLPAVAILSIATMIFAPIGVKTAHKLPARQLKISFGIMLLLIAIKWLGTLSVEFFQTLPSLKGHLKTGMAGYAETIHIFSDDLSP